MRMKVKDAYALGMVTTADDKLKYPGLKDCANIYRVYSSRWVNAEKTAVKQWIEEMESYVNINVPEWVFRQMREEAHAAGWVKNERHGSYQGQLKISF